MYMWYEMTWQSPATASEPVTRPAAAHAPSGAARSTPPPTPVRRRRASAPPPRVAHHSATKASTPTALTGRRFAWPPVKGAIAYQFELFRGARRVFATRTEGPALDVPARWRLSGRWMALSPGQYKWYVWPVRAGGRDGTATVRATLVIGRP
jgi:hypothetical protein